MPDQIKPNFKHEGIKFGPADFENMTEEEFFKKLEPVTRKAPENITDQSIDEIFGLDKDSELYEPISVMACVMCGQINNLVWGLENYCEKVGIGGNYECISYPSEYEPGDPDYFDKGILFASADSICVIEEKTVVKYLSRAADFYLKKKPEQKEYIDTLMDFLRTKYGIANIGAIKDVVYKHYNDFDFWNR